MKKLFCCLLLCCSGFSAQLLANTSEANPSEATPKADLNANPTKVRLETNVGNIVIQLNAEKAPETVSNFLAYVAADYYDGLIFHRVINGFMIQGGGFNSDMAKRPSHAPIRNESDNGLSNRIGTIAMARTSAPHSASAQFFINVNNNSNLDYAPGRWGYAVFGEVIEGMSVVNQIKQASTTSRNGYRDVPARPIVILDAVALP